MAELVNRKNIINKDLRFPINIVKIKFIVINGTGCLTK